jgi:hypothetical protein
MKVWGGSCFEFYFCLLLFGLVGLGVEFCLDLLDLRLIYFLSYDFLELRLVYFLSYDFLELRLFEPRLFEL